MRLGRPRRAGLLAPFPRGPPGPESLRRSLVRVPSPRALQGGGVEKNLRDLAGELPFLVKIIDARRPLSLQVHPDDRQARRGFARESARGVPLNAPERCYRDKNGKPEIVAALKTFDLFAGFMGPRRAARDPVCRSILRRLPAPAMAAAGVERARPEPRGPRVPGPALFEFFSIASGGGPCRGSRDGPRLPFRGRGGGHEKFGQRDPAWFDVEVRQPAGGLSRAADAGDPSQDPGPPGGSIRGLPGLRFRIALGKVETDRARTPAVQGSAIFLALKSGRVRFSSGPDGLFLKRGRAVYVSTVKLLNPFRSPGKGCGWALKRRLLAVFLLSFCSTITSEFGIKCERALCPFFISASSKPASISGSFDRA